jgi:hypothetical protein
MSAGAVVCAQEAATRTAAQDAKPGGGKPPGEKQVAKEEKLPFQIELLETRVRFEANGDSRKEVHTVVKINEAGGARQFAGLGFDYNRAFQGVEIPLVKISHANGGTSEILPSAIGDVPNPAVEKFPAYQDVRIKTVRILGLQEGDTLEYRVITTTTKAPLAPDFWLEHTFDRSGQVAEEHYELDLPEQLKIEPQTDPTNKPTTSESTPGQTKRKVYRWERKYSHNPTEHSDVDTTMTATPDLVVSTFQHWREMSVKLADALTPGAAPANPSKSREEQLREISEFPKVAPSVLEQAQKLTNASLSEGEKTRAIYEFVSGKIATVDLPLGATGFSVRSAAQTLSVGYATQEDKFVLFSALTKAAKLEAFPVLTGFCDDEAKATPRPSVFRHLDILSGGSHNRYWLDPSLEVAPFGMVAPVKEQCVLLLSRGNYIGLEKLSEIDARLLPWSGPPKELPFEAFQKVQVEAGIGTDGTLKAKLKYVTRGENELLLRMAFHQAPKERWNEVAGLLALSDGFRGHIESVKASDPLETEKPFEVEYEITQPKFVDWANQPVRIPALLPQIALPEAPGRAGGKIELGTPLDVRTEMTLRLPEGTTVETPPGTGVQRDYATYASKYEGHLNTVTASRHAHFLMREIPGDRLADYNAFVRAVKNDAGQAISLFPAQQMEK